MKILLVIALAGVVLSVIPGAGTDQDRKASLFKVGCVNMLGLCWIFRGLFFCSIVVVFQY